jgi:predicted aspartyl protease
MPKEIRVNGFSSEYRPKTRVLYTDVGISQSFDPRKTNARPVLKRFKAIWDTGATGTVITKNVVDQCDLHPISMAIVKHAGGQSLCRVYLVNIKLPNNIGVALLRVTEAPLQEIDVLIGMDIISLGDLAITNAGEKTLFIFQTPSIGEINFKRYKKLIQKTIDKKTQHKI